MSLAYLVLDDDSMALKRAVEALRIAYRELADMPYELADSWLKMAYACLVTRRVPSAGGLPEEAVRHLEGIGRPPGVPEWLHTSMVCAEIAEKTFEHIKDFNALIARLVRLMGLCLLGLLSFQELLEAFEKARDAFARAGGLCQARLLGECLQALREQGGLGDADFLEEFLRRVFVRVLI